MKKNKKKKFTIAFLLLVSLVTISIVAINKGTHAVTQLTGYEEFQKAFQEAAYSFYMRGPSIQYSSAKTGAGSLSPENATKQNIEYLVCSGFTRSVYEEVLGITIPKYSYSLLDYANPNIEVAAGVKNSQLDYRPDVIGYGTLENGIVTMELYNYNTTGESITREVETLQNPTWREILPYLKVGDIITYTGHTMAVYEIIYDSQGNKTDAYIMESTHGGGSRYVYTKIPDKKVEIGLDDSGVNRIIGTGNAHKLYYNSQNGTYNSSSPELEGSVHLRLFSTESHYKDLSNNQVAEYSILRFVEEDENHNAKMIYTAEEKDIINNRPYYDKIIDFHNNENNEKYQKNLSRIEYSKLYIEKIVNKFANSIVNVGDQLEYTITIKNKSDKNYESNLIVTEELSDFVEYVTNTTNKNSGVTFTKTGNKLTWDVGKLESGETFIINYTVEVKDGAIGGVIESTGKVANISSGKISNLVKNGLSENNKNSIINSYNKIVAENQFSGKELINKIYEDALEIELNLTDFSFENNGSKKGLIDNKNVRLNSENKFYGMVLDKYWDTLDKKEYSYENGEKTYIAYDAKSWKNYGNSLRRADTIYKENFQTGDILIYKNNKDILYTDENSSTDVTYESGEYAYIYIENVGFVGINKGNNLSDTKDDRNSFDTAYYSINGLKYYNGKSLTSEEYFYNDNSNSVYNKEFLQYQTLFGKDYYVILRPSLTKMNPSVNDNKTRVNLSENIYYGEKLTIENLEKKTNATYTYKWYTNQENSMENGSLISSAEESIALTSTHFEKYVYVEITEVIDGHINEYVGITKDIIGKRPITITSGSQTKTYDGKELINNDCNIEETLPYLHALSCNMKNSIEDVGEIENEYDVKIFSSNGSNVAKYYDITKNKGILKIEKKELIITPDSNQGKIYGTADQIITYTVSGLIAGQSIGTTGSLSRTSGENVGSYEITLGSLSLTNTETFNKDNYSLKLNSAKVNYDIMQKEITNSSFTLEATSYSYDGTAKTPSVTVKDGTITLSKDKDYTVSYSNNINAGQASVTVTGKGNYKGSKTVTFEINISKNSGTINYEIKTVTKNYNDPPFINQLTKVGDGNITYTSSDSSIAGIDSRSGEVLIKKHGTVIITATVEDSNNYTYNPKSTSYTLIIVEKLKFELDDSLKVNNNYIVGFNEGLKVNSIKNLFTSNGIINFYSKDNNLLSETSIIGTGYKVKSTLNDESIEYQFIISGDTNGDGQITVTDVSKIFQHYRGTITISNENEYYYILAGDVKQDSEIKLNDVSKLFQYVRKTINSLN